MLPDIQFRISRDWIVYRRVTCTKQLRQQTVVTDTGTGESTPCGEKHLTTSTQLERHILVFVYPQEPAHAGLPHGCGYLCTPSSNVINQNLGYPRHLAAALLVTAVLTSMTPVCLLCTAYYQLPTTSDLVHVPSSLHSCQNLLPTKLEQCPETA